MSDQHEFSGDQCVILPKNYLDSAAAVAEIYEDELSAAATNFDVDEMSRPRFFRGVLMAALLWGLSGVWTVCI